MTKQGRKKLSVLSGLLALVASAIVLFTPNTALADPEAGCYYDDHYFSHGACAPNNCWWFQPGQRCNNGSWSSGCDCPPLEE